MTTLALSFNEVNFTPVQQDGQIWLTSTEIAQSLGYKQVDAVTKIFNRNSDEFTNNMTQIISNPHTPNLGVRIFSLRGCHLVAMFARTAIAKQFRKWVLDILDCEVLNQQIESRQYISTEQAGILYNIVHTRAGGNQGLIKQMWSRLKNHFKYSASYRELRAIHFEDAKHYLELMDLKVNSKQPEVKALPYPQEVVQVAQQINQEYNQGRFKNWFISVRDNGVIGVQPLGNGYYPVNIAEFTKRFDGVLDYLYGSDLLMTGRHLQKNL